MIFIALDFLKTSLKMSKVEIEKKTESAFRRCSTK